MISIRDLSFGYTRQKSLFEGLDLELYPGNIYGLLGRNGAGKTSLMRLVSGLRFPHQGTIEVMGYTPSDRRPAMLGNLFFLNEELYLPAISLSSFVKLYSPFYPHFDFQQFNGLLEEFEVERDVRLNSLSYGQKKKVLLSFGLATNGRLLLLDEPTNGLDIPSKTKFRKLLAGAVQDDRLIIISTHQVRDISNLIDPVIILEDGKVFFNESLEAIQQKLYFELHSGLKEPEGSLYSERIPGGYLSVWENKNGSVSDIDLEVLFNAVTGNKNTFNQLFKKTTHHEI